MPDYPTATSFGSLELKPRSDTEFIGQPIDYSDDKTVPIQRISLDGLTLPRVDLIKLHIQGMESEELDGASQVIEKSRPILLVEAVKAGPEPLRAWLDARGYRVVDADVNLLAIHRSDPTLSQLQIPETPQSSGA
jgi:hypothetical protein